MQENPNSAKGKRLKKQLTGIVYCGGTDTAEILEFRILTLEVQEQLCLYIEIQADATTERADRTNAKIAQPRRNGCTTTDYHYSDFHAGQSLRYDVFRKWSSIRLSFTEVSDLFQCKV